MSASWTAVVVRAPRPRKARQVAAVIARSSLLPRTATRPASRSPRTGEVPGRAAGRGGRGSAQASTAAQAAATARAATAVPRLSRHDGHAWHLHIDHGDDAGWGDWFLAAGALALAQILTEHGRVTWGACEASNCGNFYLGTGPGSPRRYCSPTCASRARVAAHRRRRREAGSADGPGHADGPPAR
ncbi:CGNR zinc finger domain-containing protein [Streptomyces sp. MBT42]|nr:CGNR zinc finger domain-containing protein [Streptomyces sp. MBT42]